MRNIRFINDLWTDESGAVVTSELVLLGTVGVLGASVGAQKVSKALNAEMSDLAHAIRSLDQSYHIPGRQGCCGAWTAESSFKQMPLEQAFKDLGVEETPSKLSPPKKLNKQQRLKKKQQGAQESSIEPIPPIESEPEV